VIIETSEYIRCELDEAARREWCEAGGFSARRSKIALVVRQEEIPGALGCGSGRISLATSSEAKIVEYFGSAAAPACAKPPQAQFTPAPQQLRRYA